MGNPHRLVLTPPSVRVGGQCLGVDKGIGDGLDAGEVGVEMFAHLHLVLREAFASVLDETFDHLFGRRTANDSKQLDLVAEAAAEERRDRHARSLRGDVPHGHVEA